MAHSPKTSGNRMTDPTRRRPFAITLLSCALAPAGPAERARTKRSPKAALCICGTSPPSKECARTLIGYGLVVGLKRTGDSQQTQFSTQTLANILQRMGLQIPVASVQIRNVAAVFVTATLPPFAQPGTHIDVTVSSIGDAKTSKAASCCSPRCMQATEAFTPRRKALSRSRATPREATATQPPSINRPWA